MKIYWGWKDVPELAGLSRSERRKVMRDCFSRFGFGFWQFWVGELAIFVFACLGGVTGVALRCVTDLAFRRLSTTPARSLG